MNAWVIVDIALVGGLLWWGICAVEVFKKAQNRKQEIFKNLIILTLTQATAMDRQNEKSLQQIKLIAVLEKKLDNKPDWTTRDFYTKVFSTFN